MKKFFTAGALLCVMVMVSLASPAALPSYAGTWVLDTTKSTGLPPNMANAGSIEMVVTQDSKQLKVKLGPGQEVPYNLDGSKAKVQMAGRNGSTAEATVYLENKGDKTVLHSEREINVQGNPVTIKVTETWEISKDGKSLTVNRTIDSPRGSQNMTLIFTMKS